MTLLFCTYIVFDFVMICLRTSLLLFLFKITPNKLILINCLINEYLHNYYSHLKMYPKVWKYHLKIIEPIHRQLLKLYLCHLALGWAQVNIYIHMLNQYPTNVFAQIKYCTNKYFLFKLLIRINRLSKEIDYELIMKK